MDMGDTGQEANPAALFQKPPPAKERKYLMAKEMLGALWRERLVLWRVVFFNGNDSAGLCLVNPQFHLIPPPQVQNPSNKMHPTFSRRFSEKGFSGNKMNVFLCFL